MKLRFKENSLRLRLNRSEVRKLAAGTALEEHVTFPGNAALVYALHAASEPSASFENGRILVRVHENDVSNWAGNEEIGLYYQFSALETPLRIAVEKDLECLDGPVEERDPDAFPRTVGSTC